MTMTRDESIEATKHPGKFEGAPVFAAYYYDAMLDGEGYPDDDDETATLIYTSWAERAMFPELEGCAAVLVRVDEQGFVHCELAPSEDEGEPGDDSPWRSPAAWPEYTED